MIVFFALVALIWAGFVVGFLRDVRSLRSLPQAGAEGARVSVIVAARDEAARVEGTVRRLLAQRGVELEVIAVDDREHRRDPAPGRPA